MRVHSDTDSDAPHAIADAPVPERILVLRELFERAHQHLDVTIDMLDEDEDDECEPAPSAPPQ
jgi:hypothetical protein